MILAGDFNAVPWERSLRRALRIGGFLDPRVGRGLIPTFETDSAIMSWPLDQVLFQAAFGLTSLERLPDFGSDHYPVLAHLCLSGEAAGTPSSNTDKGGDLEEAASTIRAAERSSSSEHQGPYAGEQD